MKDDFIFFNNHYFFSLRGLHISNVADQDIECFFNFVSCIKLENLVQNVLLLRCNLRFLAQISLRFPAQFSLSFPAQFSLRFPAQFSLRFPAQISLRIPAQISLRILAQFSLRILAQFISSIFIFFAFFRTFKRDMQASLFPATVWLNRYRFLMLPPLVVNTSPV